MGATTLLSMWRGERYDLRDDAPALVSIADVIVNEAAGVGTFTLYQSAARMPLSYMRGLRRKVEDMAISMDRTFAAANSETINVKS